MSLKPRDVPSLRMLLVDDEPLLIRLMSRMLESLGHSVASVSEAREALSKLKTETFDAVLSDDVMPGMTGRELASEVKKLCPDLPFILHTGRGDLVNSRELAESKVDRILLKPCSINDLARALHGVRPAASGG
jgi:two-component system, cell cycle sensor histidine kinase and response regulator CckA